MRKYRYAEKCLYSYSENEEELSRLESDLKDLRNSVDVHGYRYDSSGGACGISDPVCAYVTQIDELEHQMKKHRKRVLPVRELKEEVKSSGRRNEYHRQILEEFYVKHVPLTRLLSTTHWSRSAFFARRRDLVLRLIEKL